MIQLQILAKFPGMFGDQDEHEHCLPPPDKRSKRENYSNFRRHAPVCALDFKGSWDEHLPLI